MKLELLDMDRLNEVNQLKPVTSPRLFSNKMTFDPEGVLSHEIFGISKGDRRGTFAYINLNMRFFNPHIYSNIIKRMFGEIKYIMSGQRRYKVKDGVLTVDENGWTGIRQLYEHWEEINWHKRGSSNKNAINLLTKTPKNVIFIDKMPVCPPAYRDVLLAGSQDNSDHINPLNDLYSRLIRSVALIQEGGLFAKTQYSTQTKIQEILLEIYDSFKVQISKKSGLIRQYLIGKRVDYGVRSVITAPSYRNNKFKDNMIDMEHAAVPLSQCCSMFYPFIESWLRNFFTREIVNIPDQCSYVDEKGKELRVIIKEPESQFTDKIIKKMINDYIFNPDNRFKIIKAVAIDPLDNSKEGKVSFYLKGKSITGGNEKILQRPMTVTDILYLAAVDVCEKRHVMISRYPVGTDKGIFFQKIRVRSTKNTIRLVFNNKEYRFYPDINLNLNHDLVGVEFIDSLSFSNSYLSGLGKQTLPK